MKAPLFQFIILSAGLLGLAGCGSGGGIPVDEKQAAAHVIPVNLAKEYTRSFQAGRDYLGVKLGDSTYLRDSFNLPDAEMFNRHAIALLLNVQGAEGIRVYMGRDQRGQVRMVLLPVDKNGNNIITRLILNNTVSIPGISSAYADQEGQAIENGQRCPTLCDSIW
ncbi:MAG: hypothetical protein WCF67_12395 [Chitinophagaceae bacterium]